LEQSKVMGKRILFSALFLPVVAAVVYFELLHAVFFFLFSTVLSIYAAREMYNLAVAAFSLPRGRFFLVLLMVPSALLVCIFYISVFFNLSLYFIVCSVAGIAAAMAICVLAEGQRKQTVNILVLTGNYVYTGLFPGLLFFLRAHAGGRIAVALLLILAWCNDAGAYFTGNYFGRTRGIIKSSPNKSVEGYAGSFLITMLAAFLFRLVSGGRIGLGYPAVLLLGFAMSITAPVGDMLESRLKRQAGVKDSAVFLPGLGGVLDIFDSVLLSVPVFYVLTRILLI
jgi:phosphatidate cytidylyltransferase